MRMAPVEPPRNACLGCRNQIRWRDDYCDRCRGIGVLLRLAERLQADKHVFSAWMVVECGKSWAEADGDTAEAIDF